MPEFEVIAGDMFDEIGRVEPASCRCALIDPPYMIGTQSVHRDNIFYQFKVEEGTWKRQRCGLVQGTDIGY